MVIQRQTQTSDVILALIRETFGSPEAFGLSGVPSVEPMEKIGKAILTVAAADGKLSNRERARFVALATRVGMQPGSLAMYSKFDAVNANLDGYFDLDTEPMPR